MNQNLLSQGEVSSLSGHLPQLPLPCHRVVLENGLIILIVENPVADIVAARMFLRSGSLREVPEQAGLTHLLAAVLTKGTTQRSARAIAESVESVGASLSVDASTDYFALNLKTVTADFANILALAAELLRSPTFPEPEVELERRLTLQAIRSQQEQPMMVAVEQLRQVMYQNHPYALPSLGTSATVSRLQQADLLHYHQTYFRPDNLVLSIAGRVTPAEVTTLVKQVFGDWQAPSAALPPLQLPVVTSLPQQRVTIQQTQQAIVMLGYLAPSVWSANHATLKVLSTYLGSGLSSRLFMELREKRGLAYDVSAFYPTRFDTSYLALYMGTAAENTEIALEGLEAEVNRLWEAPLAAEVLDVAKNKLLGQYALGKQTNAQIAQILGWYEILGLGISYDLQFQTNIAAVTAEAVYEAAGRYLTAPYQSLVGPVAINPMLISP